ncbi:MAG: hypothetical protein ACK4YF_01505 [Exilispira sp.]
MKKKFKILKKIIVLMIIIIFVVNLIITNYSINKEEFDYKINKNNIICYSKKISQKEVNEYLANYESYVDNFYIGNKLTDKKIGDEKLLIILCKDSYEEWIKAKEFQNKIKKEIERLFYPNLGIIAISNINIFYFNFYFENYQKNTLAIYSQDYFLPAIVIKILEESMNKFVLTLGEYNHHLIFTNKNGYINPQKPFEYNIYNLLIDEGFTNYINYYIFSYYYNYFNFEFFHTPNIIINRVKLYNYIKEINKDFLNFKNIVFTPEDIEHVYYQLKMLYKSEEIKVSITNFYSVDLFDFNKRNYFINFYSVFFYSYILFNYGKKFLFDFLHFIYNDNYNSTDEIFYKFFKKSTKDFVKYLEKVLNSNK